VKKTYPQFERFKPIFCLETIALLAFGISWLVKGKISEIVSEKMKHILKG
jgi:hypothetical protein